MSFLHQLWSNLIHMDGPSWYSLMSGCLIVSWLLLYSIYRATHALASGCLRFSFVLRHFVYPHLFPRTRFVGVATRLEGLAILVYLLVNLVLVLAGRRTNIGSRAATMSIINAIPLLCGPRLSLVAGLLGASRHSSLWSHRWFGRTVLVQVLVHTIISLTGSSSFAWTAANVFGAVASFAFGFIFLTSIGFVRHAIYEWFLNSHTLLSLLIVLAAWRHVPSKTPAWVLLRIAMGLWAGATAIHWLVFAFRNLARRRPLAAVVATRLSIRDSSDHALVDPLNVLRVDITVPRPWRVEAGQSIFLSIPSLGVFTGLRGHPFMISWWERDENGLKISLLVQSRAGFTAKLGEHPQKVLRAFIDGPYGGQNNFGDYGTVIMFASGIGIAGHMPYIKDLIRAYNSCEARTRRVLLIWHVEDERQEKWVQAWLAEALENDTGHVRMHIKGSGQGVDGRIKKIFAPPDVAGALETEFRSQRGKVVVSMCAAHDIRDAARVHMQRRVEERLHLVELDFQPSLREAGRLRSDDLEFMCRGNLASVVESVLGDGSF